MIMPASFGDDDGKRKDDPTGVWKGGPVKTLTIHTDALPGLGESQGPSMLCIQVYRTLQREKLQASRDLIQNTISAMGPAAAPVLLDLLKSGVWLSWEERFAALGRRGLEPVPNGNWIMDQLIDFRENARSAMPELIAIWRQKSKQGNGGHPYLQEICEILKFLSWDAVPTITQLLEEQDLDENKRRLLFETLERIDP
jgi:hypothetical protein